MIGLAVEHLLSRGQVSTVVAGRIVSSVSRPAIRISSLSEGPSSFARAAAHRWKQRTRVGFRCAEPSFAAISAQALMPCGTWPSG